MLYSVFYPQRSSLPASNMIDRLGISNSSALANMLLRQSPPERVRGRPAKRVPHGCEEVTEKICDMHHRISLRKNLNHIQRQLGPGDFLIRNAPIGRATSGTPKREA
jgi:hypothetical protein